MSFEVLPTPEICCRGKTVLVQLCICTVRTYRPLVSAYRPFSYNQTIMIKYEINGNNLDLRPHLLLNMQGTFV